MVEHVCPDQSYEPSILNPLLSTLKHPYELKYEATDLLRGGLCAMVKLSFRNQVLNLIL
jgi:hypothetical protein